MSKKYRSSDYSKNKYSEGVVYTFVDGTEVEIKISSVMESDSNVTIDKFKKLKTVSDEIFKSDVDGDDLYSKYVKTTYETIDGGSWVTTKSLEEEYFNKIEDELFETKLERFMNTKLTRKQKRRLEMLLDGKTLNEIADFENCSHQNISASRIAIQKKYKKFFNKI